MEWGGGGGVKVRGRFEEATQMALRMKEGAVGQGVQEASAESQCDRSFLGASRRDAVLWMP